jgi:drug/metabolite transporter (DMT)-like permease
VSLTAIALILAAAVAHATWNLLSKQASTAGAAFFTWLLAASSTVIYAPVILIAVLLTHPHLTGLNWMFLIGTGIWHVGYFLFLLFGYRAGDLSAAYPIGRGSGALLAATGGIVLFAERPGILAIAGIAAIIAGVIVIGWPQRSTGDGDAAGGSVSPSRRAIGLALATGAFIACYTLWDKYAVSHLHTPPILQGCAAFAVIPIAFAPIVLRDRSRLGAVWRTFRPQIIGAAALSPLAYIMILVALSFSAVSLVAPAREVSVLIGILLGQRLLGEQGLGRRLAAGAAIVAGILAVAVG